MRDQKSAWNHLIWFTLLGFLRPAIHIFLLPLYLVKISPSDYGILSLVLIFSSLVSSLSGFKLDVAANTFYYDYYKDQSALRNYLGQIFTINFLIGALFFLVLYFSGAFIFSKIFVSEEVTFYPYGLIAVGHALLSSAIAIYYAYLRNELKIREFVGLNLFAILLTILLQAVLILKYDLGILGILCGSLIPAVLVFLYTIIKNTWLFSLRLDLKMLRPSLIFGLGFLPISFLVIFEKQIDRVLIERFLNLEQVGVYSLLLGIVGFFSIFLMAYQKAIRPWIYESLKKNEQSVKSFINMYFKQYSAVGMLGLAGVFFIGNHIFLITNNPKYLEIIDYLPYAVAATVPLIFIKFQVMIILFYKKTMQLSLATILKTIVMIGIMLVLIPQYKIMGAILSFAFSYLIYLFFLFAVERRLSDGIMEYSFPIMRTLPLIILLGIHVLFIGEEYRSISSIVILVVTSFSVFLFEKTALLEFIDSIRKRIS